jgi:hypothetical protein
MKLEDVESNLTDAVAEALAIARSDDANCLPGWCGLDPMTDGPSGRPRGSHGGAANRLAWLWRPVARFPHPRAGNAPPRENRT